VTQDFTFANLSRVLLILCVVLHAACIFPIAQAWCEFVLCPPSMMSEHDSLVSHIVLVSSSAIDDPDDGLCFHTPSSGELMLISHVSLDWAPLAHEVLVNLKERRVEVESLRPELPSPDLALGTPPPKSSLFS